jgi:dTMP kinase
LVGFLIIPTPIELLIIVIEGTDQAGKKTQSELLASTLKKNKIKTKIFSFPDYTTTIGKEISKFLHGKRKFPPQVIHCLLAANRWEKLDQIKKAHAENSVLIMNRYYQSNLVYGVANGLSLKWLEGLDAGLPKADLVIVLDVSQRESFSRKKTNRDKFEKNTLFLNKISKTYRQLAKKQGWQIVDASGTKNHIHQSIMRILSKKLAKL